MRVKNYETVFMLTPVLANDQVEGTIAKFRDFLLAQEAEIVHEEAIGLKKLAYPINQKNIGIYHLIEFKAKPTVIASLEIAYKRDERIMRFLTCWLDKHGVEYNEKKRNGTLDTHVEVTPKQEVTI